MVKVTDSNAVVMCPWPEEWEHELVRSLASGIVRVTAAPRVHVPYPVPLQRALDRLSCMCLAAGTSPPHGVVDLMRWASRPFGEWTFPLKTEGISPDERLLIDGEPSPACLEWAVDGADVEAAVREEDLLLEVLEQCRSLGRPDMYTAFRRLLVEQPTMSEQDFALILARPDLAGLASALRRAYGHVPPEAVVRDHVEVCGGCGNVRTVLVSGATVCREPACDGSTLPLRRLAADRGVVCIARELRFFIAAPGRVELRLARTISNLGVSVALWPDFDACDLFVTFADQTSWAVDVKAWANPFRLATQLRRKPFRPPAAATQGFIVIASEQLKGFRSYLPALRNHCPELQQRGRLRALGEPEFVRRVTETARGRS